MEESMVSGNYNLGKSDFSLSDQEESSWTVYIDDFTEGRFHHESSSSSSSSLSNEYDESSSSMVSDHASTPSSLASFKKKEKQIASDINLCLNKVMRSSTRKSFKRRRADQYDSSLDPDLEDTATSPVQSSKVIDLNQFMDNSSPDKSIFQTKECYYNLFKFQKQDDSRKNQLESLSPSQQEVMMNSYTNELRRKGLCLAPLSMLFTTTTAAS